MNYPAWRAFSIAVVIILGLTSLISAGLNWLGWNFWVCLGVLAIPAAYVIYKLWWLFFHPEVDR